MSSKTRVSKQVKVKQGKNTTTFELTSKGLIIEQTDGGPAFTKTVLNLEAMDALRELLDTESPLRLSTERTAPLPGSDEVERRLTREQQAPDHPQVDEVEGLSKPPGEAEAGMD